MSGAGEGEDEASSWKIRVRAYDRFSIYLEAFNEKRNPSVRQVRDQQQVRWWGNFPPSRCIERAEFSDPPENDHVSVDDDVVLRIRRPDVSEAPRPPSDLSPWLADGWDDPTTEVSWQTERDDPGTGRIVLEAADAERLVQWKASRDEWASQVREDFSALQLYQWLWDVNATLQREGERYELVLGDGVLSWENGGEPALHPLLIQRLEFGPEQETGPSGPSLTLVEAERPPELYSGLLRELGADPVAVGRLLADAQRTQPHPLGDKKTEEFLRRAASELHADGKFLGFAVPPPSRSFPQIVRAPVIFLRTRALGFEAAIRAIKEDIEAGGEIPDSLAALSGVHAKLGDITDAVDPFEQGDEAEDVLLTKEANREQLEIARRLSRYGAVLVQGPPGTRKNPHDRQPDWSSPRGGQVSTCDQPHNQSAAGTSREGSACAAASMRQRVGRGCRWQPTAQGRSDGDWSAAIVEFRGPASSRGSQHQGQAAGDSEGYRHGARTSARRRASRVLEPRH
jgi:hypothetical protein